MGTFLSIIVWIYLILFGLYTFYVCWKKIYYWIDGEIAKMDAERERKFAEQDLADKLEEVEWRDQLERKAAHRRMDEAYQAMVENALERQAYARNKRRDAAEAAIDRFDDFVGDFIK
ncbi:Uncharacterised protein [Mycobacteroides abscessus subsp. abscessus]|uniref:hypothetical protein n=1 Tax=Mycobacteroides abscessus TaxID=36809 RepID=UPI000927C6A5|nr:hypothetical protein [Mycobacteroides abscessus]SHV14866.1 Uncharacterised protein [Mycobacteroides abscessus subsp. abscessus]SKD11168.1 Uncharacterised protein [Mycobacteroides abscessus subsp. abscessus]SKL37701.1 Uncharacterised protein [Mycobacteroides abscessus subsp. abscessus]SKM28176.1 Uncharacterised protein [Mycobacteroides abscessus subsp. abscessus]